MSCDLLRRTIEIYQKIQKSSVDSFAPSLLLYKLCACLLCRMRTVWLVYFQS